MITCTCYDCQHGHLCKHTHKVFHMHMQRQPMSDDDGKNDAFTNATDLPSPMEIGVNHPPPKTAQEEAGIGKTLISGKVDLPHK